MPPCSRRTLLRTTAAGAASVAGCLGKADGPPAATETPSDDRPETATAADSPERPTYCDQTSVSVSGAQPRGVTPGGSGETATVTIFEDYLTVTVRAPVEDPPALVGYVDGCQGRTEVREGLSGGTQSFEFGPYGHHCIQDYDFWIEGCDGGTAG